MVVLFDSYGLFISQGWFYLTMIVLFDSDGFIGQYLTLMVVFDSDGFIGQYLTLMVVFDSI